MNEMININEYDQGVKVSSLVNEELGVELSVVGSGLKEDTVAYVMAKVSRSKKSIKSVLKRVLKMSPEKREEAVDGIIRGYGHGSVRGLGHLKVCLEGISILHSMVLFNLCPLQNGQERSTRYVDIRDTNHSGDTFYIPQELNNLPELKESFIGVMNYWLSEFSRVLDIYSSEIKQCYGEDLSDDLVNKRALDCARYFLPLGIRTAVVINQSGTEWINVISNLVSSSQVGDVSIGNMLEELLVETEGGMLIAHVNHNANRLNELALEHINSTELEFQEWYSEPGKGFMEVSENGLPLEWAYSTITNPCIKSLNLKSYPLVNKLISLLNKHESLDQRSSRVTTGFTCWGMTDIGTLKDLNRHRGMFYIPLLMEGYSVITPDNYYSVPPYIEEGRLKHLEEDYCSAYLEGMNRVEAWINQAQETLGHKMTNELAKYLLPHAFNTPYCVSGNAYRWRELLDLRKNLDGHISYRNWAYECNKLWEREGYFFVPNMSKPDASSKDELAYRSGT